MVVMMGVDMRVIVPFRPIFERVHPLDQLSRRNDVACDEQRFERAQKMIVVVELRRCRPVVLAVRSAVVFIGLT